MHPKVTDKKPEVDQKIRAGESLEALNALAVLVPDNHHWTTRERWLYGRARSWLTSFACGEDSAA